MIGPISTGQITYLDAPGTGAALVGGANVYTAAPGCQLILTPGTWLVTATLNAGSIGASKYAKAVVYDTTNSAFLGGGIFQTAGAITLCSIPVVTIVTVAATLTIQLQLASDDVTAQINYNTGGGAITTHLAAVRVSPL